MVLHIITMPRITQKAIGVLYRVWPQTSKDCFKYSFIPHTISQWNAIPAGDDMPQFKSQIKSVDLYEYVLDPLSRLIFLYIQSIQSIHGYCGYFLDIFLYYIRTYRGIRTVNTN